MLQHAKPSQYQHLLLLALFVTATPTAHAEPSNATALSATASSEPLTQAVPQTEDAPSTSTPNPTTTTNEAYNGVQASVNENEASAVQSSATDEAAALVSI